MCQTMSEGRNLRKTAARVDSKLKPVDSNEQTMETGLSTVLDVDTVDQNISEVVQQISEVNQQISQVEQQILEVDQELKTCSKDDKQYLREKEGHLRTEKSQLRTKKSQLRTEESQLRTEKLWLMEQINEKIDLPAPSSFGLGWHSYVEKNGMLLHRPSHKLYGNHVTLYFQGFDEFCKLVDTVEIDKEDTKFVTILVSEMSKYYAHEDNRRNTFHEIMNSYLRPLNITRTAISAKNYYPDGCIILNLDGEMVVALILEVRNEVGMGQADSLMEAVGYYFHYNPDMKLLPCFLIELVGPHIGIYGAVTVAGKIQIDKLSLTHWLCFQPKDRVAMLQIAKMFKALKKVLQGNFFQVSKQCNFPLTFDPNIAFTEEIKPHTFRAVYKNTNVIVKFVESYGEAVHKFCAKENIAPKLLMCKQATSRFKIVVMEEVKNGKPLYDCIRENKQRAKALFKGKCLEVLKKMHKGGYCHGDFRSNNLLVVEGNDDDVKLYIIDFDWAGEAGVAKYPYFMNHFQITWPDGACDGELITFDHDTHFANTMFD